MLCIENRTGTGHNHAFMVRSTYIPCESRRQVSLKGVINMNPINSVFGFVPWVLRIVDGMPKCVPKGYILVVTCAEVVNLTPSVMHDKGL